MKERSRFHTAAIHEDFCAGSDEFRDEGWMAIGPWSAERKATEGERWRIVCEILLPSLALFADKHHRFDFLEAVL